MRFARAAVSSAVLVLLSTFATALEGRVVARSGDPISGFALGTRFVDFDEPLINERGTVLFHGSIEGPEVEFDERSGLWIADPSGPPHLVLQTWDPVSGPKEFQEFRVERIEQWSLTRDDGVLAVVLLWHPAGGTPKRGLLYRAPGRPVWRIAVEGDPAPLLEDGTTLRSLVGSAGDGENLSFGGCLGPQLSSPCPLALFRRDASGRIELIARTGAPWMGSDPVGDLTWAGADRAGYPALLLNAGGVTPHRIFRPDGSGRYWEIARTDVEPEGGPADTQLDGLDDFTMNGSGDVAFVGSLRRGVGDVDFGNNVGLWWVPRGERARLVMRTGDAAPDPLEGTLLTPYLVDLPGSRILIRCLVRRSESEATDTVLLSFDDEHGLRPLADPRQPPAGRAEPYWNVGPASWSEVGVAVVDVEGARLDALVLYDGLGPAELVTATGDFFDVGRLSGVVRSLALARGDRGRRSRPINDRGELTFAVRLEGGAAGVVVVEVPEPAPILLLATGGLALALANRPRGRGGRRCG